MLWILISIFAAAALASPLHRLVGARSGAVLSLVLVGAWGWFWWATHRLPVGQVESYPWLPSLGIELAFVTDGLSKLFGMLVLGIGVAVLVYSTAYMKGSDRLGSFFARMLFFTGSMLGLVIADDLFSLYVFWEMTTIASFFLIGWHPEKSKVRDAARSALIVTAAGGLLLMAALVAMAIAAGTAAIQNTVRNRSAVSAISAIAASGPMNAPTVSSVKERSKVAVSCPLRSLATASDVRDLCPDGVRQ